MTSYLSFILMATPVVCLTWIIVHCLIASRVKTFPAVMAVLSVILGVGVADMMLGANTPYRTILLAVLLFCLGCCAYIWMARKLNLGRALAFFAKGKEAKPLEIQTTLAVTGIVIIGLKTALQEFFPAATASWVPVLLSALFALTVNFWAFYALFGAKEFIDRKTIRTAFRFNYSDKDKSALSEHAILEMSQNLNAQDMSNVLGRIGTQGNIATLREAGTLAGTPSLASTLFNAVSKTWEDQSLVSRFQHIMIDEQFFLQPGLTIGDIAERLHTNKNYISRMVNQTYNMGFPEVLNILRIDYAEQFITTHKDLNQDEIAKACGFVSATYFNSTFKRITGYTPKVWASKGTN